MTDGKTYNVLFVCTGNSARSILAEVLIEHWGKGRFRGYSAGSFPKGAVHPLGLDQLETHHLRTQRASQQKLERICPPRSAG
jgi:arsenate reductase